MTPAETEFVRMVLLHAQRLLLPGAPTLRRAGPKMEQYVETVRIELATALNMLPQRVKIRRRPCS